MTQEAEVEQVRTLDVSRFDYAFRPRDGGHYGHIACWTVPAGGKPREGDLLILRNGARTSRYAVESVNWCMDVDPPTMWMAELRFCPRTASDGVQ